MLYKESSFGLRFTQAHSERRMCKSLELYSVPGVVTELAQEIDEVLALEDAGEGIRLKMETLFRRSLKPRAYSLSICCLYFDSMCGWHKIGNAEAVSLKSTFFFNFFYAFIAYLGHGDDIVEGNLHRLAFVGNESMVLEHERRIGKHKRAGADRVRERLFLVNVHAVAA